MENEFEVKEILEKERKNIKSLDELMNYIQNIRDNYDIGYDTAPRAITQALWRHLIIWQTCLALLDFKLVS